MPRNLFLVKRFNGVLTSRIICCSSSSSSSAEIEKSVTSEIENERPPFDINLAVILAGFAFEAYTTPPVYSSCPLILQFLFLIYDFVEKVVLLVSGLFINFVKYLLITP